MMDWVLGVPSGEEKYRGPQGQGLQPQEDGAMIHSFRPPLETRETLATRPRPQRVGGEALAWLHL